MDGTRATGNEYILADPKNELLREMATAAGNSFTIRILNLKENSDQRTAYETYKPKKQTKQEAVGKNIETLQRLLDRRSWILTEEETEAVREGMKALQNRQKLWSPETAEKRKLGIERAKRERKYIGRKPISIDRDVFSAEYGRYMRRELTKKSLAEILHVSRPTLDKLIRAYSAAGDKNVQGHNL